MFYTDVCTIKQIVIRFEIIIGFELDINDFIAMEIIADTEFIVILEMYFSRVK